MSEITHKLSRMASFGGSVVGYRGGTEEPAYAVVGHARPAEIRRYNARLAADTTVDAADETAARRRGFRILADYIFGNNQARETLSMTAPVGQQRLERGWRIRFFLPSGLTLDTAPRPNNADVTLVSVPGVDYAVVRFSGSGDAATVAVQMATLEGALESSEWRAASAPAAWFYDPPWTLGFLRRNEVAVEVRRSPGAP